MNTPLPQPVNDPVNHPAHYTSDPSGVECITITRHRNFNIGNAIKYLWRAGLKSADTNIQDLRKAIWYIEDEIKRLTPAAAVDGVRGAGCAEEKKLIVTESDVCGRCHTLHAEPLVTIAVGKTGQLRVCNFCLLKTDVRIGY